MSNRKNAYMEVYTILQNLTKEEYNKIPPEVIETMQLIEYEENILKKVLNRIKGFL